MELNYNIQRSNNRKTISLTMAPNGKLEVLAPCDVKDETIDKLVQKKKFWIYKNRKELINKKTAFEKEYVSGESFLYLGKKFRLDVAQFEHKELLFKQNKFILNKKEQEKAETLFEKWYKQKAKEKLIPRVEKFAKQMGLNPKEIKILSMSKRWGSCTPDGNIILNYHLIKAPLYVVDYVIVHELAHLIEHNHSEKFWKIVKTQMGDFTKQKEWLGNLEI